MMALKYVAVIMAACLYVAHGQVGFRVIINERLKSASKVIVADGSAKCALLCSAETMFTCETASWGKGTCLLSPDKKLLVKSNDLAVDDDWITLCRTVYPGKFDVIQQLLSDLGDNESYVGHLMHFRKNKNTSVRLNTGLQAFYKYDVTKRAGDIPIVTLERVNFDKLYLAIGTEGTRTLTFEAGKTRCVELGGRIATREELLYARSLGFELCRFGWLSDGTLGFVLQQPRSCWHNWSDGIIGGCVDCEGGRFDVYCRV